MPQFDFRNVFWPQFIWLAIFFAILYFGVVRLTLPRLGRVMTEREDRMSGDIAAAETAKRGADRIAADYEAEIAEAQQGARAKVTDAQHKAQAALEAKLAESNAVLEERTRKAEVSIAEARANAMGQIQTVAAEAAADIVERLTGARPSADAAARAAQAALA